MNNASDEAYNSNAGDASKERANDNIIVCEDSDYLDLDVRDSQITGAGKGLWVKRDFCKGETLAEYRGKIIKSEYCWDKIYDYEDKMVWLNDDYCVIGNNIAACANDCIIFQPELYGSAKYR